MAREFLTIIIPLLLPTALYLAWRFAAGRGMTVPSYWIWLVVAGLALASVTLIAVNVDFGAPRGGIYVPPHVSDGTVVPGHIEPGPAEPQQAR
jgi:hypothetical protein